MEAIKAKARIGPNQEIIWLEPLPELAQGEVEVILLYLNTQKHPSDSEKCYPLRDKPVRYELPFAGVVA